MNELITIKYENDNPTVSARELYEFLEVETPYRLWFPRMCEYGFSESLDYTPYFFVHPQNKQEIEDNQLTIAMAKEICMLQRNEKGKQARQYFLKLEEEWNSPEKVMSRALVMAQKSLEQLKTTNLMLEQKVCEYEPKAQYVDEILQSKDTLYITQIAADYGLSARKLNKILNEEHVQHNVSGQWILYKDQMNKGLTKSETIHFKRYNGKEDVRLLTKWTQKGRLLIHSILSQKGIVANIDKE